MLYPPRIILILFHPDHPPSNLFKPQAFDNNFDQSKQNYHIAMENRSSDANAQARKASDKPQGTKRVSLGLTNAQIVEHKKHREQQLGHKIVPRWEKDGKK